jgi:hypothetical protein
VYRSYFRFVAPFAAEPHGSGMMSRLFPWRRNELARKEKSIAILSFLSLRQPYAFDLSVYACPRLFQTVDITVGVARNPAMALQLLDRVWHR